MVTRVILVLSFLVSILASGITTNNQKFLSLSEALEKDHFTLKALVEKHLAQRLKNSRPVVVLKITKANILNQSLLEIHIRGEHLTIANNLVENSFLAGKDPWKIFKYSKEHPGILKWLLTVPLKKWPSPSKAHFFLAWIFNQTNRGFDLALWLEKWFEADFRAELGAVYSAKNMSFLEHIRKIPCDTTKSIPESIQDHYEHIIKYDAVNALLTRNHEDLYFISNNMNELVAKNAINTIRYLKEQNLIQSLTMEQVDRAIRGKQVGILEIALELGHKLEVTDAVVALQSGARECIQFMEKKMPGITLEGIFQIGMYKRGPISVEIIQTANIIFGQKDLNRLGVYLPITAINYIYSKQKILPNYPEMKEAAVRLMDMEKPSGIEADYEDLMRSFKHLNLDDGQSTCHNVSDAYIDEVVDATLAEDFSIKNPMDGRLLDFHLCMAKKYGTGPGEVFKLLNYSTLAKKKPLELYRAAIKDDFVGIYWVLQAVPLNEWTDKRMARQFLIKIFEHDYFYNEALWSQRCLEADFSKFMSEIYPANNPKFLAKAEILTRSTLKPSMPVHFLQHLGATADRDAARTVRFFLENHPTVLEKLKRKEMMDLLIKKRAIKSLHCLEKSGIVLKFEPDHIESAIRNGHADILKLALESNYALKETDVKLAVQQTALEYIKMMMDKMPELVRKVLKEMFFFSLQSVPVKIFDILEIDLIQELTDTLPLNVSTEFVKNIYEKWSILPCISKMRKVGTIELELVKYLKTLPLNRNLSGEQASSYFKDVETGGYDSVTKLRLSDYYLFVAMKQFGKSESDTYDLFDSNVVIKDLPKIYTQVLEDQLAWVSKHLQLVPQKGWRDTEAWAFFNAKVFDNDALGFRRGLDSKLTIQLFARELIDLDSSEAVIAIFAANNPSLFSALQNIGLLDDFKKKLLASNYGMLLIAANDAVEAVRTFEMDPEAIKKFENNPLLFTRWDAVNIIGYMKERNPSLEMSPEMIFNAVINDSSYILDFALRKGGRLQGSEIELAITQKSFSCIRVMMAHDPKFIREDFEKIEGYSTKAFDEIREIIDSKNGHEKQKVLPEKKSRVILLTEAKQIKKYGVLTQY